MNTFGRYISRNTMFHRYDGRLKIICFFFLLTMVFVWHNLFFYLGYIFFLLIVYSISKTPWKSLITILKSILFMLLFLLIFNLFFTGETTESHKFFELDNEIFRKSFLRLTFGGIIRSFYYTIRVLLVILLSMILTSTTRPETLTYSIESLLSPLRYLRFPIHIFSTIISLTLRLVPTLAQEAAVIMKAQASRGLDFHNGGFRTKIRCLVALLIPLIVSIFNRAEEIALSMEARGYDPYSSRTRFQQSYIRKSDWIITGVIFFVFLLFFLAKTLFLELGTWTKNVIEWTDNFNQFLSFSH